MTIFVGDWVFAAADGQWHAIVDVNNDRDYAKLDNGFWVSASESEIQRVLSKDQYLKNFTPTESWQ